MLVPRELRMDFDSWIIRLVTGEVMMSGGALAPEALTNLGRSPSSSSPPLNTSVGVAAASTELRVREQPEDKPIR
jgi:hypothetical protein